ncbi:MAG: ATP-binding protein [Clostridia bacterium]|nr:ATP-binding protein [Clostridia bacterium]
MTEQDRRRLALELSSLSVFRGILKSDTLEALLQFLNENSVENKTRLFGQFVFSLADDNYCFSDFLRRKVYSDENKYITLTAQKAPIPKLLEENALFELRVFSKLTGLTADELWEGIEYDGYKPKFQNEAIDFTLEYKERLRNIDRYGYGIFATSKMFKVEEGEIIPVSSADSVSIDDFVGYEAARQQVFDNTEALIEGKPAANVLLFGDAGTGKSSTVKACANFFYDKGVRLIEIRKDQLFSLSYIMGRIADNPLKFIIFIDDLSFNKNDDCFSMLKAALEGSASAKASNAVIYATSNRRHIVKENFSDRAADNDIHHSDTVQELLSLSDRFGLTVYFERPNKSLYLDIVHTLAQRSGVTMEQSELDIKAEAFALQKGSRSPRAAEQFINSLI